jgi:drug/metabolite transporter (DMT)-like permease
VTVFLALVASALFGTGVALQQRPAWEVPDRYAARLGLLARVARRPIWLIGVVAEVGGFGLQVLALRHGSLVVVQPVITTSLLFTIGLAAVGTQQTVTARDWLAVVAVVAGLSAFLIAAAPSEHSSGQADADGWIVTGLCVAGGLAVLVGPGLRTRGRSRAALLGLAAGLVDALMAVLTKAFAHALGGGAGELFRSWSSYALCAVGVAAMLLTQTAYQAGRPTVALPLITVADPIASCAIGVGLFGEVLRTDGFRGPAVVAAVLVMTAGLVVLSRSTTGPDQAVRSPEPSQACSG